MSDDTQDQSSKTEEPTEKKLSDARKKGDVPASRETGTAAVVFGLFCLVVFVAPAQAPTFAARMGELIAAAPRMEVGTGQTGIADLAGLSDALVAPALAALMPALLCLVIAAVAGVLLRGETVVALERIKPKASNISVSKGIARIASTGAFVEFVKSLVKLMIVAGVAGGVVWVMFARLVPGGVVLPEALPAFWAREAARILAVTAAFLVPVAIADAIWQRLEHRRKNRMSHKDIKDEHKNSEGSPEIKQRRAERRQEQAKRRIAQTVPTASVVLTNPTHYAVALRYEQGVDAAPVCVAKGADAVAARIREIARDNDIPVVESKALARALHAGAEIDRMIPEEHWPAVAEIVAYIMDLRRRVRRQPPAGARLRTEP